jgi:predicted nucleic acid-binding protein
VNLVDSSAWLEYFSDGRNAAAFAAAIEDVAQLVVSSINCYEVYKRIAQQRDDRVATEAVAAMRQAMLIDVTPEIALSAASLSLETRLPMADSLILASARACGATLWTQDGDFAHMAGVRYFAAR